MLVSKLRMRAAARLRGEESGFTLVELLVVMLILGLLAAIAIPSFFDQRDKATDADSKASARTAQTSIETYATDNGGTYTGATPAALEAIEETLVDADLTVPAVGADTYTVTVTNPSTGNTFSISRAAIGSVTYPCTAADAANRAGCPADNDWGD